MIYPEALTWCELVILCIFMAQRPFLRPPGLSSSGSLQMAPCGLEVPRSWNSVHLGDWVWENRNVGMDQYLLIPFLVGWTSIYQLFWCELQGYKVLTHCHVGSCGIESWWMNQWPKIVFRRRMDIVFRESSQEWPHFSYFFRLAIHNSARSNGIPCLNMFFLIFHLQMAIFIVVQKPWTYG